MCMYMYKYRNTRFSCRALFGVSCVYAAMQSPWFHCLVVSFQTPPLYNGRSSPYWTECYQYSIHPFLWKMLRSLCQKTRIWPSHYHVHTLLYRHFVGPPWLVGSGDETTIYTEILGMCLVNKLTSAIITVVLKVWINTRGMKTDIAGASTVMHRITGYRDSVTHVHTYLHNMNTCALNRREWNMRGMKPRWALFRYIPSEDRITSSGFLYMKCEAMRTIPPAFIYIVSQNTTTVVLMLGQQCGTEVMKTHCLGQRVTTAAIDLGTLVDPVAHLKLCVYSCNPL